MTSTAVSDSSNLTRGYTVAVVSAAILSTTAIFIRHLTQTYRMPALVLAYLLFGERLSGMQLGGSLLILSGVALLRVHEGRLAGRPSGWGLPNSRPFGGQK